MNKTSKLHQDSICFHHAPWKTLDSSDASSARIGRPCVDAAASISHILCVENGQHLPLLAEFTDDKKQKRKLFELPAAQCDEITSSGQEVLNLNVQMEDGAVVRRSIVLGDLVLTPPGSADIDVESLELSGESAEKVEEIDRELQRSLATQRFVDAHGDAMNSISDNIRLIPGSWDGKTRDVAVRSLQRTISYWENIADKDEPPQTLVVELARTMVLPLRSICDRPHKLLQRVRSMVPVGAVQEVDDGCLRWLARQPGRTLLERAGPKQRILGITRVDNLDTTENRVLKDLLSRLADECRRYCKEYIRFKNNPSYKCKETGRRLVHPRYHDVEQLLRVVRSLQQLDMMRGIKRLVGTATPNYVLQHDSRYKKIWQAHQQLVRHQKQQDTMWRWRNRALEEFGGFAMLAALNQLTDKGPSQKSDLFVRRSHQFGQFLTPTTEFGLWEWGFGERNCFFELTSRESFASLPKFPEVLKCLAPAYFLRCFENTWAESIRKEIAIFVVNGISASPADLKLGNLARCLEDLNRQTNVLGLVLVVSEGKMPAEINEESSSVKFLPVNYPASKSISSICDLINTWVGLA